MAELVALSSYLLGGPEDTHKSIIWKSQFLSRNRKCNEGTEPSDTQQTELFTEYPVAV
jgi:hypothetical protein